MDAANRGVTHQIVHLDTVTLQALRRREHGHGTIGRGAADVPDAAAVRHDHPAVRGAERCGADAGRAVLTEAADGLDTALREGRRAHRGDALGEEHRLRRTVGHSAADRRIAEGGLDHDGQGRHAQGGVLDRGGPVASCAADVVGTPVIGDADAPHVAAIRGRKQAGAEVTELAAADPFANRAVDGDAPLEGTEAGGQRLDRGVAELAADGVEAAIRGDRQAALNVAGVDCDLDGGTLSWLAADDLLADAVGRHAAPAGDADVRARKVRLTIVRGAADLFAGVIDEHDAPVSLAREGTEGRHLAVGALAADGRVTHLDGRRLPKAVLAVALGEGLKGAVREAAAGVDAEVVPNNIAPSDFAVTRRGAQEARYALGIMNGAANLEASLVRCGGAQLLAALSEGQGRRGSIRQLTAGVGAEIRRSQLASEREALSAGHRGLPAVLGQQAADLSEAHLCRRDDPAACVAAPLLEGREAPVRQAAAGLIAHRVVRGDTLRGLTATDRGLGEGAVGQLAAGRGVFTEVGGHEGAPQGFARVIAQGRHVPVG